MAARQYNVSEFTEALGKFVTTHRAGVVLRAAKKKTMLAGGKHTTTINGRPYILAITLHRETIIYICIQKRKS